MNRKQKIKIIDNLSGFSSKKLMDLKRALDKYDEEHIKNKNKLKFYCSKTTKSGPYFHKHELEGELIKRALLKVINYKVQNDAPRGGEYGDFIELTYVKLERESIQFIKDFLEIY